MALGELVGESSGRITATRVLNPVAEQAKLKVSFQGSGIILGVPITDTATYWQVARPRGFFTARAMLCG